jgi:hypothetical protein
MHKTHKQNINKQHQNINKQLYLNSDYVLYIASKQLRDYGYCFAIIDVKARHIVSHFYKATPPNLADMIDCLSSVSSFLPNVKFINSNPEYLSLNQYFDKLNVKSATGTLNQIVQRTFRTLTNIIKNQDNPALHEAIKIYNNKPHKALHGMTPNQMRQLLFPQMRQLLFPQMRQLLFPQMRQLLFPQMRQLLFPQMRQLLFPPSHGIQSNHKVGSNNKVGTDCKIRLNGNKVGREQTCKIRLPSDVGREETCKIILPSEVGREKIRLNGVDIDREETCKISEYKLQVSQHYAGNWQQFFIDKKDKMPKSKNYATV